MHSIHLGWLKIFFRQMISQVGRKSSFPLTPEKLVLCLQHCIWIWRTGFGSSLWHTSEKSFNCVLHNTGVVISLSCLVTLWSVGSRDWLSWWACPLRSGH